MAAPLPFWLRQAYALEDRYGQSDRSGSGPQGQPSPWGVNQAAMRMAADTPRPVGNMGGPTVEVPRANRSSWNPNTEPMLFGNSDRGTPNRPHGAMDYDGSLSDVGANAGISGGEQWWEMIGGGANATPPPFVSGDAGGSVWAERSPVRGFAEAEFTAPSIQGNAGGTANADISGATGGLTAAGPEYTPSPPDFNPENPFEVRNDYTSNYLETPPESTGFVMQNHYSAPGQGNLGSFGGNLSLGPFLNTPLSSMRYGEGYPGQINYGGRPRDLQPGEGYLQPDSERSGHWVEGAAGSTWVDAHPNPAPGDRFDPVPGDPFAADRGPSESYPDASENATSNPDRRTITYRDFIDPGTGTRAGPLSAEQYRQQTFGGLRGTGYRDTRGSATYDPRAFNAMQMWYQSMGGTPNDVGRGIEPGGERFYNGMRGRINRETGEIEQIMPGDPDFQQIDANSRVRNGPATIRELLMAQRSRGQSGVRGRPPVGANTGGGG